MSIIFIWMSTAANATLAVGNTPADENTAAIINSENHGDNNIADQIESNVNAKVTDVNGTSMRGKGDGTAGEEDKLDSSIDGNANNDEMAETNQEGDSFFLLFFCCYQIGYWIFVFFSTSN